jgi:hypothetical protein
MWRCISVRRALKEAFAAFYDLRANPIPQAPQALPPAGPAPASESTPATKTNQNDLPEIGFEFSTSHDTLSLAPREHPDDRFQE